MDALSEHRDDIACDRVAGSLTRENVNPSDTRDIVVRTPRATSARSRVLHDREDGVRRGVIRGA